MSLNSDTLNGYAHAIDQAAEIKGEAVCAKIADQFEDKLMDVEGMPAECFDFIKMLLSEATFYNKAGIWNFLMVLSAGRHRLGDFHYQQLATIFRENYQSYGDSDLCLAVCDFIARNYHHAYARTLLKDLQQLEDQKLDALRGAAAEGLHILSKEIARSSK